MANSNDKNELIKEKEEDGHIIFKEQLKIIVDIMEKYGKEKKIKKNINKSVDDILSKNKNKELQDAFELSNRTNVTQALIMNLIDNFKKINVSTEYLSCDEMINLHGKLAQLNILFDSINDLYIKYEKIEKECRIMLIKGYSTKLVDIINEKNK